LLFVSGLFDIAIARRLVMLDIPITVNVSEERLKFAEEQVDVGGYATVDAVVEAGLQSLQQRAIRLSALDQAIQEGLDSGDSGPWDFDAFLKEMKSRHKPKS
jgi:antitoxin ParD1/3/4